MRRHLNFDFVFDFVKRELITSILFQGSFHSIKKTVAICRITDAMYKLSLILLIASRLMTSEAYKSSYRIIHEAAPWNAAFRLCRDVGGRLATIESEEENLAVVEHLQSETLKWPNSTCFDQTLKDFHFWIAGRRINPDEYKLCEWPFFWNLPNDLFKPLEYTNWGPNEPDCLGGSEGCMEVTYSSGFKWNDISCSTIFCSLCQIV